MSSHPKRKSQKQSHEALVARIAKEMARPRKTASVLREELKRGAEPSSRVKGQQPSSQRECQSFAQVQTSH